jgi:L-ascorbate metabolism protein UlaG (beta-lactamase superfamily)
MHWGTFQLTSEPMLEPPERLALAMEAVGADVAPFETLAIGETIQLSLP